MTERNPEDNVIDEIDELVNWQLAKGEPYTPGPRRVRRAEREIVFIDLEQMCRLSLRDRYMAECEYRLRAEQ